MCRDQAHHEDGQEEEIVYKDYIDRARSTALMKYEEQKKKQVRGSRSKTSVVY